MMLGFILIVVGLALLCQAFIPDREVGESFAGPFVGIFCLLLGIALFFAA